MNDRELLASFREIQDEGAFEAMVSRHGPMVLRVCRDILADPDAADDAFQATFLLLVRRVAGFHGNSSPRTWLARVSVSPTPPACQLSGIKRCSPAWNASTMR